MILIKKNQKTIDESLKNRSKSYIGRVMDGTNIGPIFPPIPVPDVTKVLLPGGKQNEMKLFFDDFR